jgi:hypothetical protein
LTERYDPTAEECLKAVEEVEEEECSNELLFSIGLGFSPRHRVRRKVMAAFFGVSRLFFRAFGTNVVELESRVKISLLKPTIIRLGEEKREQERRERRQEYETIV